MKLEYEANKVEHRKLLKERKEEMEQQKYIKRQDKKKEKKSGGITVIYTPGHTPGHISLHLKQSKTLITGDALFVDGGLLVPAPRYINFDKDLAMKSLEKFTRYDIEAVICYHGGVYTSNANQRIAGLINGQQQDKI